MFITQPSNIDYLLDNIRFRLGDFEGTQYSTTLLRTALVNAVKYLQPRWNSKYQVYSSTSAVVPQPATTPAGYINVSTTHGDADIINDRGDGTVYTVNDIFRNPFITFTQTEGIFEQYDEEAVVLAALYLTHTAKLTGNSDTFVSWRTEDLSYSNLGGERARQVLLSSITEELNRLFKDKIARPSVQQFAPQTGYYTKVY